MSGVRSTAQAAKLEALGATDEVFDAVVQIIACGRLNAEAIFHLEKALTRRGEY